MLRGSCEIGQMCGLNSPELAYAAVSIDGSKARTKLEAMTSDELRQLVTARDKCGGERKDSTLSMILILIGAKIHPPSSNRRPALYAVASTSGGGVNGINGRRLKRLARMVSTQRGIDFEVLRAPLALRGRFLPLGADDIPINQRRQRRIEALLRRETTVEFPMALGSPKPTKAVFSNPAQHVLGIVAGLIYCIQP